MKRLCAEPGCNEITAGKRCLKHTRTGWHKTDEQRAHDRSAYGASWKAIRDPFIAKHPVCQCSGYSKCDHRGSCTRRSTDVDHVKRRADRVRDGESPDAEDNLQALCSPCHTQKTLVEVHALRGRGRTPGSG